MARRVTDAARLLGKTTRPFTVLNPKGTSPIVLLADHAASGFPRGWATWACRAVSWTAT